MTDVKVILFDWGGTLCSVKGQAGAFQLSVEAAGRAAAEAGHDLADDAPARLLERFRHEHDHVAAKEPYREIRIEPILSQWLTAEGVGPVAEPALARLAEAFWAPWVGCLRLLEDADQVLRALRARGYRLGLVSNVATPPHWCHEHLENVGLRESLEAFAFSSEVGHRKPHPAIYRHAIEQINANGTEIPLEKMLFVGDSPEYDVAVPARMGMKTALLPDEMGFWDPDRHASVSADLRISRVSDLLGILPGC